MITAAGCETGFSVDLAFTDGGLVKTSKEAFDTLPHAEFEAEGFTRYVAELGTQPLRTPIVRGIGVVEASDGYHVRHTCDFIDGPSLTRLGKEGGEPHHTAVAQLLAQVVGMDTIAGGDDLAVPFDSKADNIHVDADGPALIDMSPAMSRTPDGSFPLEPWMRQHDFANYFAWCLSTKTGAMIRLLATSLDRGDTTAAKVQHVIARRDDWCYDALPRELKPRARDQLRRQIAAHFIPFALRVATHRALHAARL